MYFSICSRYPTFANLQSSLYIGCGSGGKYRIYSPVNHNVSKEQYCCSLQFNPNPKKQGLCLISIIVHWKLDLTPNLRTTRLGVWSKTRSSVVHWTSGFQNFFLTLNCQPQCKGVLSKGGHQHLDQHRQEQEPLCLLYTVQHQGCS